MRKKDQDLIMDSINECIASGFPELDADIQKARDALRYYRENEGNIKIIYSCVYNLLWLLFSNTVNIHRKYMSEKLFINVCLFIILVVQITMKRYVL